MTGYSALTKQGCFDADLENELNRMLAELFAGATIGSLTDTHILVGNAANVAADVAVSGDATLARTGALTVVGVNGSATARTGAQINLLLAGVVAGYKIARSAAPVAVTGTSDITTGLATVLAAVACPESDLDGTTFAAAQAVVTGGAGHILLKTWKITAADNGALIAASVAKNVSWIAIGT